VIFRAKKHGCRAKTPFRIPHKRSRIVTERYDDGTGARPQSRELISQQSITNQPVGLIGLLNIPTPHHWIFLCRRVQPTYSIGMTQAFDAEFPWTCGNTPPTCSADSEYSCSGWYPTAMWPRRRLTTPFNFNEDDLAAITMRPLFICQCRYSISGIEANLFYGISF
jgi:hypothetical protein